MPSARCSHRVPRARPTARRTGRPAPAARWNAWSSSRSGTADGAHDVVLLPVPDAGRSAAGVQRLEVVLDGWRFEVDLEPEARAALRERATRASGDIARGGPLELRAIIPGRVLSVDV